MTGDAVRASQRERLLRAMLECVAEYGFGSTTVTMVVTAARVSRTAFYERFEDKVDCFLVACDGVASELLGDLVALTVEPDWIQALRTGISRYLRWWELRPAFARAYLVSIPAAGERAVEQRDRVYAQFAAMFADLASRARVEQPDLPALSPLAPRVLVWAITELVAAEVRAGRTAALHELEPELTGLAIRLLADDSTAAAALGDQPVAHRGVSAE